MNNGEEIYQKYCSSNTVQPTMFPKAPIQTYIDLYPDIAVFRDEIQRQTDYEAEVKVYRALEKLSENLIVLHNFKFNHNQYCLCDTKHKRDKKKCDKCRNQFNTEGECDFLVICPDLSCFVIIEVKNMAPIDNYLYPLHTAEDHITDDSSLDNLEVERKLQALVKTFRKSTAQRKKITSLIKCIDENARILQFTAYPNFRKQFGKQFQSSKNQELRLCDGDMLTVMFQEDFRAHELPSANGNDTTQTSNFQDWWTRNIPAQMKSTETALDEGKPTSSTELEYNPESFRMARNMLLAIWATEKNDCDQSKCSLEHSILEINKQLEHGLITLETKEGKHRERNFNVTKAPDVFREYVGVDYLTTEQLKVFNSEENLTWINGPAGAGKTVILCGILLQLVLSEQHGDSKVVVFQMAAREETSLFERAMVKSGIQFGVIKSDARTSSPARLKDSISRSQDKVVLVKIIDNLLLIQLFVEKLNAAKDCYLLVDDLQRVLQFSTEETFRDLVEDLKTFSLNRRVWIGCDLVQAYHMLDYKPHMKEARVISQNLKQWNTLSVNLRNTFELSNTLSVIREQFVQSCVERSEIIDTIMPKQISGHFIHGPKIELHIVGKYDETIIHQIVKEEQEKLEGLNTMTNFEMCLLYDPTFCELVHEINPKRKVTIEEIYSYEWPAVIALLSIWKHGQWELPQLYLAISRARVYSCVIIIAPKGDRVHDFENLQNLLRKLKEFVSISYH